MSILIHYSIVNVFTNWFGRIHPEDRDLALDQSFDLLRYCMGGRSWSTRAGAEKGCGRPLLNENIEIKTSLSN